MFDKARFLVLNTQIYHTSHYLVPLSLPSAQMYKCNHRLLPFPNKQTKKKYPNDFNVKFMIYGIVDACKKSKAYFATIFAFAE